MTKKKNQLQPHIILSIKVSPVLTIRDKDKIVDITSTNKNPIFGSLYERNVEKNGFLSKAKNKIYGFIKK